jgi:hypothetical protein
VNFKLYDILSMIIPGLVIVFTVVNALHIPAFNNSELAILVFGYLIGYINNTIASWAEDIIYWTWGGKPSSKMLDGKDIFKVRFYESLSVKEYLIANTKKENPSNDELFHIAMRIANSQNNQRVQDFNESYAFSRSILVSTIVSTIILTWKMWNHPITPLIGFILSIILWIRCKQRAFYYVREVLTTCLNHFKQQKSEGLLPGSESNCNK